MAPLSCIFIRVRQGQRGYPQAVCSSDSPEFCSILLTLLGARVSTVSCCEQTLQRSRSQYSKMKEKRDSLRVLRGQ
jgi:hypothetical protein